MSVEERRGKYGHKEKNDTRYPHSIASFSQVQAFIICLFHPGNARTRNNTASNPTEISTGDAIASNTTVLNLRAAFLCLVLDIGLYASFLGTCYQAFCMAYQQRERLKKHPQVFNNNSSDI